MPAADRFHRPNSLHLAQAVRALGPVARRLGLTVPGFRSPPRLSGASRTIRRHQSGSSTVAVVMRGRPWPAVLADLVEGIIVANGVAGTEAARARRELWAVVAPADADMVA